jgi:non-homologous end joining protein Ku
MWSGTIKLGLIDIPVTIGKSWADEREQGLRDLCATHNVPVDRTERCSTHARTCQLEGGKVKGVHTGEKWVPLSESEYSAIEDATKSDRLEILDVQPVYDLPIEYGTGTYYVRYDKKVKGFDATAFAHFAATLSQRDLGVVVKWCKAAKQRLAVLHTSGEGILLLTTVPFASEWREPGDQEIEHRKIEVQPAVVEQMGNLLDSLKQEEFDHERYSDEGMKLRSDAVEKILDAHRKGKKGGKQKEEKPEKKSGEHVPDLMAALQASMQEQKLFEGEEQKEKK